MKKAVLWLSVVALVCDALFLLLFFGSFFLAAGGSSCGPSSAAVAAMAASGCANNAGAGIALALLVLVVALIPTLVAWVLGLIRTAQVGAWGWFVLVFLISPLGSLIYGIAGPDQKKVEAPAGAYPGQPR